MIFDIKIFTLISLVLLLSHPIKSLDRLHPVENSRKRAKREINPNDNLYIKKYGSTSQIPNLDQAHSTEKYAILSKVTKGDKLAQQDTISNIKENLNKKNEVIESVATERNDSIIKQSSGVDNLKTLKDIFDRDHAVDNSRKKSKEELARKKKSRKLNDGENEGGDGEVHSGEDLLGHLDEETLKLLNPKKGGQFLTRIRIDEDKDDHEMYVFGHNTLRNEYDAQQPIAAPDDEEIKNRVPIDERFHIQDLTKVGGIARDMRDAFKEKIVGGLQNKLMLNKLEISYEVYEDINEVRKKYHFYEDSIDENSQDFFNLIDFLTNYISNSELDPIVVSALDSKGIDLDKENHELLMELMQKLDDEVKRFSRELMITFKTYITELDTLHYNQDMKDFDKVKQMVEIGSNMSLFENNVIEKISKNIGELTTLAINNPRYHHLSNAFQAEPVPQGEYIPADKATKKLARASSNYESVTIWSMIGSMMIFMLNLI